MLDRHPPASPRHRLKICTNDGGSMAGAAQDIAPTLSAAFLLQWTREIRPRTAASIQAGAIALSPLAAAPARRNQAGTPKACAPQTFAQAPPCGSPAG